MDKELRQKMKSVRKHYQLAKITMSRICGFGDNQWRLYENGDAEPNKSNLKLIKRCCTPTGFKHLLQDADPKDIHKYDRAKEISEQTMETVNEIVRAYKNSVEEHYFDQSTYRTMDKEDTKYKGYALDCSGWIYGTLHKDNPRFETMIYDGNEYIAVDPETVKTI